MPSPQKEKGKRFERDVAQLLAEIFNKPFMRVPNSGAFTGGKNKSRITQMSSTQVKGQRGDIIAPDEFSLITECKNHRNFSRGFSGVVEGNNKVLDGWLNEVYLDSDNGVIPYMLVFKITGESSTIFFALPESHFKAHLNPNTNYTRYFHKEQSLWYDILPQDAFRLNAEGVKAVAIGM